MRASRLTLTTACMSLLCFVTFNVQVGLGQTTDDNGFRINAPGGSPGGFFDNGTAGFTTNGGAGFTSIDNSAALGQDAGFRSVDGGNFVIGDANGGGTLGSFINNSAGGFVDNGGAGGSGGFVSNGSGTFVANGSAGFLDNSGAGFVSSATGGGFVESGNTGFINNGTGGFIENGNTGFVNNGTGGFVDNSSIGYAGISNTGGVGNPSTLMLMRDDTHAVGDLGSTMTMSYGLTPTSTTAAPIPFFDIDTPTTGSKNGFQTFHIDGNAKTDSMAITSSGVGIGTGGWANTGNEAVAAALHVYQDEGGATGSSPFNGGTGILAENANTTVADRGMMRLHNNGAVFFILEEKNPATASEWQFFIDDGKFSLRQQDERQHTLHPQLTFNADGQCVFGNTQGRLLVSPSGVVTTSKPFGGASDRNLKENVKPVDPQQVLSRVAELPISTWNYIEDENDVPHMGPMAQDFSKFFGLGDDDKSIAFLDHGGVALAAIQGLAQKDSAKDKEIASLGQQLKNQTDVIAQQDEQISTLTERLEALETIVSAMQK